MDYRREIMLKRMNVSPTFLVTVFCIIALVLFASDNVAYAAQGMNMELEQGIASEATLQQATSVKGATTQVELGSGIVGTKKFTVNQQDVRNTTLAAVIKWRKDALNDSNVKFNGETVKNYLKTLGISESTYLNPSWSNALERIALQRAIEAGDSSLGHTRPNGTSCSTATYSGISSNAEVLAWGSGYTYTGTTAVDQWATEKAEYVKECKGQSHTETGHYVMLINPDYKAYGFALCAGYNYDNVAAGEAATSLQGSNAATNLKGEFSFDIAISNELATSPGVYVNLFAGITRINIGETYTFSGTLAYRNNTFTIKDNWYSTDSSVLQVETSGKAKALKAGTADVYILGQNNQRVIITMTVPEQKEMYRFYNPNSGEHFYTADASERDYIVSVGWKYENVGWNSPFTSKTPVYRLYNPNAGDHHYTTDAKEKNYLVKVGWSDEGIGWYSDDSKSVSVYRQYNPNATTGTHNFTISKDENDNLVKLGWRAEGIAWYGVG